MFDSLDEQMKHDRQDSTTPRERVFMWVAIPVLSVLLFGGLFLGVRLLE
jgi:hypothetical protein